LSRIWAWCLGSHQWNRVLLWVGLLVLWILLALATNVGVTGGFTHDLVAVATPGPSLKPICESVEMGVDARCYRGSEAMQVSYPSAVEITISVVGGSAINCQTTSDRISGDIMVKPADLPIIFRDLGCKSHMEP
jgi:hypothetical protein